MRFSTWEGEFPGEAGSHLTLRWRAQSGANSSLKSNSLLAGNLQGISSILASVVRITCQKRH
jgi:hypothetical protein